jgi:haloacid dehalogenase superfamily, subfamily IA, variant 3 with third motif having DD or ED/haloacid dehalogenase superfamily, subfamily IA, variant 1 with third motif having Dx(3-4)D or Dx(3-4)E
MGKCRNIFFDVGNTLLFPNRAQMLAPLPADRHPTLQAWQALERRREHQFDQGLMSGKVDHGFWWTFHTYLLQELDAFDEGIRTQLIENTQNSANWDQILPGTRDALERIRKQYGIAVISNADGRIDAVLGRCGICDCFASITDSGNVGHEKPHPAIFTAALREMKADPADSLYVGDVYSVDYVGARNAGMQAVLFDVAGAYRNRELPRVESLLELENWLQK